MRPDQALTIYELRALNDEALKIFDQPGKLLELGSNLAGLHWEADFAFVFFTGTPEPMVADFLYAHPSLDLKHIHHLTYAQWQDGAGAEPLVVAGLTFTHPARPAAGPQILIDPGLAFGFGGHPTTLACLGFLARAAHSVPAPSTALDLGSGTGILSLAAAAWGLARVVGVDYSHLAVEAALDNLRLNHLKDRVSFFRGPAQNYARHPAEILMANLHLSLQEELFALGAFQNRRFVIASGLLPSEGEYLIEKLKSINLKLIDLIRTDRWISLFMEKAD